MLDFFMRLLGYENIRNIKVPNGFSIPGTKKLLCKAPIYHPTVQFLDKVIIKNDKLLLYGYTTYILSKWLDYKYIKVIRIDIGQKLYKTAYKNYKYR